MTLDRLRSLGWDASFADAFRPYAASGLSPARVAARHHGPCVLLDAGGALGGVPAGGLDEEDLPAVGDWVAARRLPGERKAVIEAVLPRRTAFLRKEAWRRTAAQVLAANVDVAFLVAAPGRDLSVRRLERYLALAADSGAEPRHRADEGGPRRRPCGGGGSSRERGRRCPRPHHEQRHRRGRGRASRPAPARTDRRAARLVRRREVDAREPATRTPALPDATAPPERPRTAHHDQAGARPAPRRRTARRHAGPARGAALGGRRSRRAHVRGHRGARGRVPLPGLPARA